MAKRGGALRRGGHPGRRDAAHGHGNRTAGRRWLSKAPLKTEAPSKAAAKHAGPRWGRIAFLILLLCGAGTGYLLAKEWVTWKDASALAHDLETEHEKNLDAAWDRYQSLAKRANLNLSVWSAQEALRNRLLADTDHVLTEYRIADAPALTEADWTRARASAARALELAPHDRTIRSKIRDIDGQLNRIRGTARHDSKMSAAIPREFSGGCAAGSKVAGSVAWTGASLRVLVA